MHGIPLSMPSADAQSFKEGLKSIGDKIGKQIVKTAQSVKKQTTSSKTFDRDKALQKQWNFLFVRELSACKKTCIHLEENHQIRRIQGLLGWRLHVETVILVAQVSQVRNTAFEPDRAKASPSPEGRDLG